jgi:hypothetical protein
MLTMVGDTALGMRRGRLLLAGALLISACSGTASETNTTVAPTTTTATTTTTTPPTTTTTSTTTTQAPTTTTVDPMARPEVLVSNMNRNSIDDFETTGDNLYRVVMEHQDLFNYLEGNPTGSSEEMVGLLFNSDYPLWNVLISDFDLLSDNPGWRYADPGVETLGIEVLNVDEDVAKVRIADRRGTQVVVNPEGNVVLEFAGWDRSIGTITLRRGEDRRWRFFDLSPSESLSDDELSSMVPIKWTGR